MKCQSLKGLKSDNIICLHSRFFGNERKEKEERLKALFGKSNNESAILISTQVIEAGMDISCDTMHVEISPINSFLQRAGRGARWENESGKIYVYDIPEPEQKLSEEEINEEEEKKQIRAINNRYLPYKKDLCEASLKELKNITYINTDISQNLVDRVLKDIEFNNYSRIQESDFNRSKIQESWDTCEKKMYSQTIRDIQNIDIVIIDYEKEKQKIFYPYSYQTIGLYKWSFIKQIKDVLSQKDFDRDKDVIFIPERNLESVFIDFDTNDKDGYTLKPVRSFERLKKNDYDIVFVDKSIFRYTPENGLEIGNGDVCSPLKPYANRESEMIKYQKDTFEQHVKAMILCYEQEFKPKLQFVFNQLNKYWEETIDWDRLIKVVICLHDYGKLNNDWQKVMRHLQQLKAEQSNRFIFDSSEVLAHSDFDKETDGELENISRKKPAHAGIGALALIENAEIIIGTNEYEALSNSISTAILKHHGVETESYPNFEITDDNYAAIESLLIDIGLNVELKRKGRAGKLIDCLPVNSTECTTYLFFVRLLRLIDQKATKDCRKYLN
jgi:CRISPR-associated endonuclease/helicase Cas3